MRRDLAVDGRHRFPSVAEKLSVVRLCTHLNVCGPQQPHPVGGKPGCTRPVTNLNLDASSSCHCDTGKTRPATTFIAAAASKPLKINLARLPDSSVAKSRPLSVLHTNIAWHVVDGSFVKFRFHSHTGKVSRQYKTVPPTFNRG